MSNPPPPEAITAGALNHSSLSHGFFTRSGGASEGVYAGLNCGLGSNDRTETVIENRGRAMDALGVARDALAGVHQIHSADVWTVDEPRNRGAMVKADAVVTDKPGVAAGVLVADCGPVLFADPKAGVVAAAHAGWGGAFKGVLENTVRRMESLGARRPDISAALGPCIRQPSYEVGPEFKERFVLADTANARFFKAGGRAGRHQFDLAGFVVSKLKALDLGSVEDTGLDTYPDEERFYSYRRATHRGEPDYGRLLAAIALKNQPA